MRDSREEIPSPRASLRGKELSMDESLLKFAQSVKVTQCRVFNTPNLIFLCGGRVSAVSAHGPPFESVRDYFFRYIQANQPAISEKLRRAEEINDWFDGNVFRDLLELEEYLADLSDVIILFVESPGSIAELGAFAMSTTVCPKILTVINTLHPEKSFIADGPVRRLRSAQTSLVYSFEWDCDISRFNTEINIDTFRDMSEQLADVIMKRREKGPKEGIFNPKSPGHAMLMIADLTDIIGIVSKGEIIDCLFALGMEPDGGILKKYLYLLERLQIIKKLDYSNQVYYVATYSAQFIRYDFLEQAMIRDRKRAKFLVRQGLKRADPRRAKIYSHYLQRASQT